MKNIKHHFRIQIALFFSVMLHVLFGFFNLEQFQNISKVEKKKEKRVRIVLRSKKSERKKQIVTSVSSDLKKENNKKKFLSKKTQFVDRETVAKVIGKFKEAGVGSKTAVAKKMQQKVQKKKSVSKKIKKRPSKKKKFRLSDLAATFDNIKNHNPVVKKGIKNGKKDKRGLGQNNDFVEDLPLGDMTKLNTVEFKYYGFYFRIKQQLEQFWGSSLQEKAKKLFRKGHRFIASENKITSLKIELDNAGNIVDIIIKGSSGIQELDDAAIEAFNKAGPFPNPPKGMIKRGKAIIEWGFVVKS